MGATFSLDQPPVIIQAGLSVHGYRREEAFEMHDLWSVHLYLYAGSVRVGETTYPFENGCLSITPPNTRLSWQFPDHAPHYYAHVSMPSASQDADLPVVYGPLTWLDEAIREFEFVGGHYLTSPSASQARLWSLLWRVMERDGAPRPAAAIPAPVQIAASIIEQSLSERIVISELARRVGVSHNHLIKLFRGAFDTTVAAYVRGRRCRRAAHLLQRSSLSIKSIAQEVGIPDLHHFNKTIRAAFGCSPSQLRQRLVENHIPQQGRTSGRPNLPPLRSSS